MKLRIQIGPKAEAEIEEAARWYAQRSAPLATQFLLRVEEVISEVAEAPQRFPVLHRDIRRALLGRFPYGVFFRLKRDHVKVIAVIHQSRDPGLWRRR